METERDFRRALAPIIGTDERYTEDAYMFLREALDFTNLVMEIPGHVTGQQLLEGARRYALQRYGPMARYMLNSWGIEDCMDIGNIVFNMVNARLLGKTEEDSIEDFRYGYDFEEAFDKPFI